MSTGGTHADGPAVPSPRGPAWSRHVGRFAATVVWSTRVTGAEHVPATGPVILAANHTGVVDGPLLLGVAPRGLHVLVKQEMFHGPVGAVLRAAGQIPVDRDGGRAALVTARAVLERGDAVGVFPEGNRGRGDASSGRAGVAWLALHSGAPVVPVAMLGTRRTGESTNHLPGLRRRIEVEMGAPVTVRRAPGTSGRQALADANEQVRAALADLVARAVARTGVALPTDGPEGGSRHL
ncbi:1-acyl-sn-glycerol-3-phosphate acyltransferase [Sediminihabitans luteus]|uniref:1-acyl-sn-glycerol-3-phosphate acyltransferase n=1 Tax=Sediminihabitans luteus TaxID=1138585 RepID=A0A2M9CR19_9CELL|nr:lysophospholipid acyltransferase family protein [Sediminihabitans luteus]PJJ74288.1 1-acyl-sn-glycerol-3-phosphate acyltransferase [Sediminihabitans luteus]GII99141.1 1-acyl-sn-glycerol-3-phosphate acyltransferase [Sediminihabitans luteus]